MKFVSLFFLLHFQKGFFLSDAYFGNHLTVRISTDLLSVVSMRAKIQPPLIYLIFVCVKAKGWPSTLFCRTRFHFYENAAVEQSSIFVCLNFFFYPRTVLCMLWAQIHSKVFTRIYVFHPLFSRFWWEREKNSRYASDRGRFPEHPRIFEVIVGCIGGENVYTACLLKIFTNSEIRLLIGGLKILRVVRHETSKKWLYKGQK